MVEKLWKAFQFGLFFDNVIWRELLVSFVVYNIIFFRQFVARTVNFMFVYISINVYVFDLATSKKKAKNESQEQSFIAQPLTDLSVILCTYNIK